MSKGKKVRYKDILPHIEHPLKGLCFYDVVSIIFDPEWSKYMKEYAARLNKEIRP